MPKNKLIVKYAKEIGIEENIVNEVLVSFFTYFKGCMKKNSLPDIRLKGFGIYRPALSRLKQYLKSTERRYSKGLISEEEYNYKIAMITKYLEENEFKKSHD